MLEYKVEPVFTDEDTPYLHECNGRMVYVFGLRKGKPDEREVYHRKLYRLNWGRHHLMTAKMCPLCNHRDTEWIRGPWSVCYVCEIVFEGDEVYYEE